MSSYDNWKATEPVDPYAEELEIAERAAAEEEDKRQGQRRELALAYAAGKCHCENCTASFIERLEAI
jgi:hypothetical protein